MKNIFYILILSIVISMPSLSFGAHKEKNIIKFGRDIVVGPGRIVRGAAVVVGNISVDGTVEDDVVAVGGSVSLGARAKIGGNVVSVGGVIDKNSKAVVEGNIVEVNVPGIASISESVNKYTRWKRSAWIFKLTSYFGMLLLALLAVAILPVPVMHISEKIEKKTVESIMWSLRGLLFIVPLAVILTMSVAGIFLIPLEVIVVVACSILGYIVIAQVIGKLSLEIILKKEGSLILQTFMGITILTLIGFIPTLGWVTKAVITLIGFGGVLAAVFSKKKPKQAH